MFVTYTSKVLEVTDETLKIETRLSPSERSVSNFNNDFFHFINSNLDREFPVLLQCTFGIRDLSKRLEGLEVKDTGKIISVEKDLDGVTYISVLKLANAEERLLSKPRLASYLGNYLHSSMVDGERKVCVMAFNTITLLPNDETIRKQPIKFIYRQMEDNSIFVDLLKDTDNVEGLRVIDALYCHAYLEDGVELINLA